MDRKKGFNRAMSLCKSILTPTQLNAIRNVTSILDAGDE
jgi:hypothetical protein